MYKDLYLNVGFEFIFMINYLREIEIKEVSIFVYCGFEVGWVEIRVRCFCLGEFFFWFLCKFLIIDLVGKIGYYWLDIGFEYFVFLFKW